MIRRTGSTKRKYPGGSFPRCSDQHIRQDKRVRCGHTLVKPSWRHAYPRQRDNKGNCLENPGRHRDQGAPEARDKLAIPGGEKVGLTGGFMKMLGRQSRKPSGWFGKMFGHSMAWGHRPLTNWGIGFMDIQPTDRILDVGCGSGMAIKLIARIAVDGFVAGIDYSEVMVQQALKRNAAAVRAGRVEVRHGNISALSYDDEFFDKVIGVETFYFWPDPVANLKEARRVLRSPEPAEGKPGGLVALAMEGSKDSPNRQEYMAQVALRMEFPIYSGAEMEERLTAAGFSRAWFESAPDKGWGWLCALGVK